MKCPDHDRLAEAAPIALDYSRRLCADVCRYYHGIWLFARLFGTLPGPSQDHSTMLAMLSDAARDAPGRVLIAGAADFGILAYVIEVFSNAGVDADVTVVDRCQTPLEMNCWYGQRENWPVRTVHADIRSFDGTDFDLIVAHNVLNFFDSEGRSAAARTWAQALRPGGSVRLVATVRPSKPGYTGKVDPAKVETFAERAKTHRRTSPHAGLIEEETLADLARGYALKRINMRPRSIEDLCEPFVQAGLEVETACSHEAEASSSRQWPAGARIGVVARKPG